MDLQFHGANCLSINYKGTRVVIDDNLADLGGKTTTRAGDVALFTANEHSRPKAEVKLMTDRPGEYEVGDVSIKGVAVRGHMDEVGKKLATMYKITAGDVSLLIVGHAHPDVTGSQLEDIGVVQVMAVPVGGMGYTLDAIGALKLIKEIEPKIVIPTHYADTTLSFPVPQQEFSAALTELGIEPKDRVSKLKLKAGDLGEGTQLIVLEKS